MEVITFSVLSAILVNVLCVISYMYYKRYKAAISEISTSDSSKTVDKKPDPKKTKQNSKKAKPKKNPPQQKKKPPIKVSVENDSDTESYTTEQQLAQTIISQHQDHVQDHAFSQDSINMTAVNAKPTIKKLGPSQRSNSKTRKGTTNEEVVERDPDWENVISRKHKKKLYPITKRGEKFEFTLDDEGGIVELPFCEIHFPAESVTKPLHISVEAEKYKKFVEDEKVFATAAVHFTMDRESKLRRQFTMKLHTLRIMGRGWDGNVFCQIETRESGEETWLTVGRTAYIFAKPIQIVGNDLTSFRAVITRGQNGAISRDLNIAAYIARPKVQNPEHHYVHLCIYDKSQQFKVEENMQRFLSKMEPRNCNVTFGSDLQFKIQPTKKFTPDEKEVFMRWTELCKAFVNVRFQIRLNRNESDDPTFEPEYRTAVFLKILKVGTSLTTTQEEYFHIYWISATTFYPKKRKGKGRKVKGRDDEEKVSEDDGFASGSDALTTPETENPPKVPKSGGNVDFTASKPPIAPKNNEGPAKRKRNRKKPSQKPTDDAQSLPRTEKPKSGPSQPRPAIIPKPTTTTPVPQPIKSYPQQNQVQSFVTKDRPTTDGNKPSQVKRDTITNSSDPHKKVNSQVQSKNPPTVPPQKGNPKKIRPKGPQKSSMPEKKNFSRNDQSVVVKSQEFIRKTENEPSYVPKSTVNGPQSAPNSTSTSAPLGPNQRRGFQYRFPKKNKQREPRDETKARDPGNDRSSETKQSREKGNSDETKNSTQRQQLRPPAPPGGNTSQGKPSKTKDFQSTRKPQTKDHSNGPQPARNDVHERPQQGGGFRSKTNDSNRQPQRQFNNRQERDQSSITNATNRDSASKPTNRGNDRSLMTKQLGEKGAGDETKNNTQHKQQRETAPPGGDANFEKQSKTRDFHGTGKLQTKDPINGPRPARNDTHERPQQGGQPRSETTNSAGPRQRQFNKRPDRNQSSITNHDSTTKPANRDSTMRRPDSDSKLKSPVKPKDGFDRPSRFPTKTQRSPQKPRPQQNGPVQKPEGAVPKGPATTQKSEAKLVNGVTNGESTTANPAPKDRRPRRPRDRQRGPPPSSNPQPQPIKTEAS